MEAQLKKLEADCMKFAGHLTILLQDYQRLVHKNNEDLVNAGPICADVWESFVQFNKTAMVARDMAKDLEEEKESLR